MRLQNCDTKIIIHWARGPASKRGTYCPAHLWVLTADYFCLIGKSPSKGRVGREGWREAAMKLRAVSSQWQGTGKNGEKYIERKRDPREEATFRGPQRILSYYSKRGKD